MVLKPVQEVNTPTKRQNERQAAKVLSLHGLGGPNRGRQNHRSLDVIRITSSHVALYVQLAASMTPYGMDERERECRAGTVLPDGKI